MAIDYNKKLAQLKRTVLPLLAVAVLTAGLGCAKSDEEAAKKEGRTLVLPVQIGRVVYRDVVDEIRTVGNIRAEQRVMIASEVAGQILNIPVEEGTKVRQGDLLIEIDSRQYQLEVELLRADLVGAEKEYEKMIAGLRPEEKEKLKAQVKTDESALKLAHKNLQRFENLVEEGVISQSVLDEAIDRARRSEENLRSSKATLAAS
ncbi:MAG: biotin/lipoyl-binding protein, partial [Nitrospinaceae bacterium]